MLLQCFSKNDEGSVTRLNNNLYFALTAEVTNHLFLKSPHGTVGLFLNILL